jgi:hypothetical protein
MIDNNNLIEKLRLLASKNEYRTELCELSSIYSFVMNLPVIHKCDYEEHRWYSIFTSVVKIKEKCYMDDFYVSFNDITYSGDECPMDKNELKKLFFDSLMEVIPKEVTTTKFVPA